MSTMQMWKVTPMLFCSWKQEGVFCSKKKQRWGSRSSADVSKTQLMMRCRVLVPLLLHSHLFGFSFPKAPLKKTTLFWAHRLLKHLNLSSELLAWAPFLLKDYKQPASSAPWSSESHQAVQGETAGWALDISTLQRARSRSQHVPSAPCSAGEKQVVSAQFLSASRTSKQIKDIETWKPHCSLLFSLVCEQNSVSGCWGMWEQAAPGSSSHQSQTGSTDSNGSLQALCTPALENHAVPASQIPDFASCWA